MSDEAVAEVIKEYPSYKCHKVVKAAQISHIGSPDGDGGRYVYFINPDYPPIFCPEAMFARRLPVPGDYLVVYRDDYKSFSPKSEFEDGYSLEPPLPVLPAYVP